MGDIAEAAFPTSGDKVLLRDKVAGRKFMDSLTTVISFIKLIFSGGKVEPSKAWVVELLILPLALSTFFMTRHRTTRLLNMKYGNFISRWGFFQVVSTVILMPVATLGVTWDLLKGQNNSVVDVMATVMVTILYWSIFFHLMAFLFGAAITHLVGPNWVRSIDYFYLLGSTVGILRVAAGKALLTTDLVSVNAAGVVILGIALSLRLTKTSIEIFQWDKLSKQELLEREREKARRQG